MVTGNVGPHRKLQYRGKLDALAQYGFKEITPLGSGWESEDVPLIHSTRVDPSRRLSIAMLANVDADFVVELRRRLAEGAALLEGECCNVPHYVFAANKQTHEVSLCPQFISRVKASSYQQVTVSGSEPVSNTLSSAWQVARIEKVAIEKVMALFELGLVDVVEAASS